MLPLLGYSQEEFSFPDNFRVDPYSFKMKVLNMKRIEQHRTTFIYHEFATLPIDSFYMIDYILAYDSAGRISSFKYDFQKEYEQTILSSPESQVTIYAHNDSSRLERAITNLDTSFYNYCESQFLYNEFNQLDNIQIIRPYRGGIIDGVYIKEPNRDKLIIEKYYTNNLLSEINVFLNDKIQYSETYTYSGVRNNEKEFKLLTKIIRESNNQKDIFQINYLQY